MSVTPCMRIITIALLTTLATLAPAQAQDVRFHDAQGRVTGSAHTNANGVTIFHDRAGRVTGTAHRSQRGYHVPRRGGAYHRLDQEDTIIVGMGDTACAALR